MANTKEIQDRIKSINDTLKITNAMYMISSSKLKKAKKMLVSLYTYYQEHPEQMSREYRGLIGCGQDKTQVVCDYIAGMTDQYSMHQYEELFVPKAWAVY